MTDRLSGPSVAALLGIKPATWRNMVRLGQAPRADGLDETFGRQYWLRPTIERWNAQRPGKGGRPPRSSSRPGQGPPGADRSGTTPPREPPERS